MIAQRIKQARLAAAFSLDECVQRLAKRGFSITKPALSQYENGKRVPHASTLHELAALFSVPSVWLVGAQDGFSITWYAYRAQARLGKRRREEIEAFAALQAEKNASIWRLFSENCTTDFPPRHKIATVAEAESVAGQLRKRWNLGSDALESVTQILETHGAMVVHYDGLPTACFDGLSALICGTWPLMIVNSTVSIDRLRFDLAHELGHILMDTSALGDEKHEEAAAHRFASSLLMPPSLLKRELGAKRSTVVLSELLVLKQKYGISVGALLFALRDQGMITEATYTGLQKQMSARGWRKNEPQVFKGNEQPMRLRQLITRALAERLIAVDSAIGLFPHLADELEGEFGHTRSAVARLRRQPKAEREKILREAVERAAEDYANNPELIIEDTGEFYEYE
jgi:Zn-dependent peptidase ImmA (M78 family)/transcriptional regulator with XRE-family HTH domain